MADEEIQDYSLVEDVFLALSKPGSLMRQVLMDADRGYRTSGAYGDIFSGDRQVTPRDFIKHFEEKYGRDIHFGDEGSETTLEKAGNFGFELLVDIFTSPDSLISLPTKMLKAGKVIKAIDNKVARKATERAITGATLGALSTNPDDDWIDTMQGMATGAATFAAGPAVGRHVLDKAIKPAANRYLSGAVERLHKDFFRKLEKSRTEYTPDSFLEAGDTFRTMKKELKPMRQLYMDLNEDALVRFENAMAEQGIVGDDAVNMINDFRLRMAQGFSTVAEKRNANVDLINEILDRSGGKNLSKINAQDMEQLGFKIDEATGKLFDRGEAGELFDRFLKSNKDLNKYDVNRLAALGANDFAYRKIYDEIDMGTPLGQAMLDFNNVSEQLADNYKSFIQTKVDDLKLRANNAKDPARKAILTKKADELENQLYVPLAFHTVDMKTLGEGAEDVAKLSDVAVGQQQRISSKVMKDLGKDMREEIVIGSNRYAMNFADETQKEASRIMYGVLDSEKTMYKELKGKSLFEIFTSKDVTPEQRQLAVMSMYDRFIDLMKTKHLATGTSWLITNYTDNVLKTYAFAGASPAIKAAVQVPLEAGIAVPALLDEKLTGGLFNFLTAGNLKKFSEKTTFDKMLKAFDPNSKFRLRFDDDAMDLAAVSGAIDSTKYMDLRKSVATGELEDIIGPTDSIQTGFIGGKAISERVKNEFADVDPKAFLGKTQDFFWDTSGAIGSGIEGTFRYMVFKDTMDSMIESSPMLSKQFKKKGSKIYGEMMEDVKNIDLLEQNMSELKAFGGTKELPTLADELAVRDSVIKARESRRIINEASKKTNSIFFDYNDVTAFEQHVMKRIFPYWTFTSRNFAQWLEDGFADGVVNRTAKVAKVSQNLGMPLTEEERLQTPQWLLEKGAKKLDSDGEMRYAYQPNSSLLDAMTVLQDPTGTFTGKLSPLAKQVGELISGRESFGRDQPLFPTTERPKKRVLESALSLLPDDQLRKLNIVRDENGRMFTNKKAPVYINKLMEMLPVPQFLGQMARAKRDMRFKDEDSMEWLLNIIPAFKTYELLEGQGERLQGQRLKGLEKLKGDPEDLLD